MGKSPSFVDYVVHIATGAGHGNTFPGNVVDEGPAFSLFSSRSHCSSTDAQSSNCVQSNFHSKAQRAECAPRLLELHPSDTAAGSPFGNGDNYIKSPQFKRIAAFQGD
ncbi:hypothetical protein BC628DRAFT_1337984 [Trametes gibbosa]|nr:hypothetical protein BC628DRAFT_1337984 [Trametes gibbosa]